MKKELKEQFPKWTIDKIKYDMMISNDLDSLISAKLLEKHLGYNIAYYYDFKKMYKFVDVDVRGDSPVGIDIDFTKLKCWGNHTTIKHNPESANINNILKISSANYTDKCAISTVLQIIAFYDLPIHKLSDEQLIILFCIDGSFVPFYNERFRKIAIEHFKNLGLDRFIEIAEKYEKSEFIKIIQKYNLQGKFRIENNKISTNINLDKLSKKLGIKLCFPDGNIESIKNFNTGYKKGNVNDVHNQKKIISEALVQRNTLSYTYLLQKQKMQLLTIANTYSQLTFSEEKKYCRKKNQKLCQIKYLKL